jgi:hypothetical protein
VVWRASCSSSHLLICISWVIWLGACLRSCVNWALYSKTSIPSFCSNCSNLWAKQSLTFSKRKLSFF